MTWIPVTERLPETDHDVLVIDDGEMRVGFCEDGAWYCAHSADDVAGVSHWQPLPPPPESE